MHSEFNHAPTTTTHFLQIWIQPDAARHRAGLRAEALRRRRQARPAAPGGVADGRDGSVTIHADAAMYAGLFDGDESASLALDPRALAYVHLVRGSLRSTAASWPTATPRSSSGESRLQLDHGRGAEVLVFDLAR